MSVIATYKIINTKNQNFYVGYSSNVFNRLHVHEQRLLINTHPNIKLQRAINKYGIDNFDFSVEEIFDSIEEAKEAELKILSDLTIRDKLYNMHYNNSGGDIISHHPNKEDIIQRMTSSLKSYHETLTKDDEVHIYGKFGAKNGMYGKTHTPEVREILSNTHKNNQYCKGKKASVETRKKMSDHAKTRVGELNPFFGKSHNEESKKKISESNLGKVGPSKIPIIIDGIKYDSCPDAAKVLNIYFNTIRYRVKSSNPLFAEYKYANSET